MRLRDVRFAVAPLVALAALALLPASSAAAQPELFVEIGEPVEVNAETELELRVVLSCLSEGVLRVRVAQGRHSAEVTRPLECLVADGPPQEYIQGLRGFHPGPATVSATIEVPGGGVLRATRKVEIVRQPPPFVRIDKHAVLLPPAPPPNVGEPERNLALTVEYRCLSRFGATEGRMFVGVRQGSAFAIPIFGVTCDGQTHREVFDVYQPYRQPWHKGTAEASANTEPEFGYGGAGSGTEINIE